MWFLLCGGSVIVCLDSVWRCGRRLIKGDVSGIVRCGSCEGGIGRLLVVGVSGTVGIGVVVHGVGSVILVLCLLVRCAIVCGSWCGIVIVVGGWIDISCG